MLLECVLNSLSQLLLPELRYDGGHAPKDRRLWLPTHYELATRSVPWLLLYKDMRGSEHLLQPGSRHFRVLDAMLLEYEFYTPHLRAIDACPTDVYQFSRVVRAVSGLRPNIRLSQLPLLRHYPLHKVHLRNPQIGGNHRGAALCDALDREVVAGALQTAALQEREDLDNDGAFQVSSADGGTRLAGTHAGGDSFRASSPWIVERPEGVTIHDLLHAIVICTQTVSRTATKAQEYAGCRVLQWGAEQVDLGVEFEDGVPVVVEPV